MLLAASRIGQLSDGTAFRPWLYAIARNRFLDSRRDRRQALSLDRLMERTGGDCSLAVRSSSIEQWAESELIQQVFSRLSVEMREALYLRYVAGYAVGDIAAILDIAPMAVYQRLHRARRAFGNHYAALNHEPTYDGVPREANGTI